MRNLAVILACFLIPSLFFSQEKRLALDFDESIQLDLSQSEMKKAIDDFGGKLKNADIGLFFYAGHGLQARGRNYLVPTDAQLKTENDVEYNCVDAGRILAKLEDAGTSTNIIILDACRNNPFERSWKYQERLMQKPT